MIILPYDVFCEEKLMNGEDHPWYVTQEEHTNYTGQNKGKISFSSPGFPCADVCVPATDSTLGKKMADI